MHQRLFRALLRLLPEEFRAGYARDMQATFGAELREAEGPGRRLALARLWLATVADLLRTAPAQHLDVLAGDLRYALRALRARPAHALAAGLTLGLVIGANVAMFAVVDGVLLQPLPYRDPDALVAVAETARSGDASNLGYLSFADLRERARSFERLCAVSQSTATLVDPAREALRVSAMRVSRGYFEMLGVTPAIGRPFSESEDRPGAARRVAILSDSLWRRRFDADPGVLGRPLDVGGIPFVVVGVLPRGFEDLVATRRYSGAELFFPLGYDPTASYACRTCRHLGVYGRLAAGVDLERARGELDDLFGSLEAEHPAEYAGAAARLTPLRDLFLGPVRPVLLVLWGGVAALLLVACAHVANLLLLRASERTQEIAVRTALGVTRWRLARQLVTESLVLAFLGGAAGLLVAGAAVRALVAAGPQQLPRLQQVGLDGRAFAVSFALTAVCGVGFGLVPLRQLLRGARTAAMPGRTTAPPGAWRLRSALVAANLALAALLLVGSGLLARSLGGLLAVSPGFDAGGVLTLQLWLSGERFRSGENAQQIAAAVRFYDDLLARARALPGVTAASAVTTLPLGGGVDGYGLHLVGRPLANPEAAPSADRFVVAPQFFSALRIPLLRGRLLDERDAQGAPPAVVINRTAAEALFPNEDPLGRQIALGPPTAERRTIVGVVGDIRHHGLDVPPQYQVFVPQAQWPWAETFLTVVVRSQSDPRSLVDPLRDAVRALDPAQPVTNVRLYEDVLLAATATRRFAAGLLACFAATALALALVGLYGALGVFVGQRRREIGVRLALGADARAIARMVLALGLRPALSGLCLGLALAASLAGALRSLLYEVTTFDPATFAGTSALLLAVTALACLLPAVRAASIDPAETLRTE
ncbi:MAG: ABC transporter permease [Vicinamibacteria bacterium]